MSENDPLGVIEISDGSGEGLRDLVLRAAPATGEARLTGNAKTIFAKCDGEVFEHDGAWKCYKCGATGGAIANADTKTHTVATGKASPEMRDLVDNAIFGNATAEYTRPPLLAAIAALESQLAALTDSRDEWQRTADAFASDVVGYLDQIKALTRKLDAAEFAKGVGLRNVEAAVKHNADSRVANQSLRAQLAALRAENDRLKGEREQSRIGYKTAGSTEDTP